MFQTVPFRLKGAWTLGSPSGGQGVLNFSLKFIATQAREKSCTAKANHIVNQKGMNLHVLQQHAEKRTSVLGDLDPSKDCPHHCFFARDGQIFPLQKSSQLTIPFLVYE